MKRQCRNPSSDRKPVATGDRGLKLLPYTIRENLPILGSQQHLRGKAKVWAKCGAPDVALTWYITEGSAKRNPDGRAVDYLLYGLAEGERRALDYFWLSDLMAFRSPAGLPVERDTHWRPRTLQQIAPELFSSHRDSGHDTSKPI